MGALWSTTEEESDETRNGLLASLVRAIDLRRLSPYHASAVRRMSRKEPDRDDSRAARIGIWLPEGERMRERRTGRLAGWIRFILHTDDTPPRAALAFAVGVFIAWTPALGFHTLLALAIAFLFGLNRVAVLAGTFVNNPWTLVPIYTASAWLGSHMTGADVSLPRLEGGTWGHLFDFLAQCRPWIVPLTMGTLVLGLTCALVSFPVVLFGIRWYRALRHT